MKFWDYLNISHANNLEGITEAVSERLSGLIGRGHSIADLLAHYSDDFGHLPAARLQALARARRGWVVWRKRRQQLEQARLDAKLAPLPAGIESAAVTPHALDSVIRTARLCTRDDCADEATWLDALRVGAELWNACIGLARKKGIVRCKAKDLERASTERASGTTQAAKALATQAAKALATQAAKALATQAAKALATQAVKALATQAVGRYEDYLRDSHELADLAPHRWLAMRRGVQEGVLELSFELPREAMLEQTEFRRARLGPAAAEREPASLLDELVLDDLEAWLCTILDQEAEASSIASASEALAGLLRSMPLQARRLGALFVGRAKAPVGVVIADREGELLAKAALKPEGIWLSKVSELLREYNVHHVALPASAPASEVLSELEAELTKRELQLAHIRPAAMAEAKLPLTDPPMRLSPSVASALVLARRALDPIKEWALVDPVAIGVADYQHDLSEDRLRAALKETVELCKLERRRGGKTASQHHSPSIGRGSATMARLNPMVKSITDLRGGMTVHGVVTNISHFGAFVNIGLAQEALVHISELSDRFVSNPNEVVRIGQQVNAHVLSVDPSRGRISLSMKAERPASPRGASDHRPPRGGARGDGQPPQSRAEALASLERLFKK